MECEYNKNNICALAKYNGIAISTEGKWCAGRCDIEDKDKQTEMIKRILDNNKKGCGGGCGKMKTIAKGFGELAALRIFGKKPPMYALERGEQCAACEYRTFLDPVTWGIEAIKGLFTDKPLPINHEPGQFDILWCSKCGCNIEAAILVEEKTCMENKWPAISGENKE